MASLYMYVPDDEILRKELIRDHHEPAGHFWGRELMPAGRAHENAQRH
jgi:hypothetical protein